MLRHKLDTKIFPNVGTYFRIASFFNNLFDRRLNSDTDFSEKILEGMKAWRYI